MSVTPHQWHRVRNSVPAVLGRLLDLVEKAPTDRLVTARWSAADTMAHLAGAAAMGLALVRNTPPDLPVPALLTLREDITVDTISLMNAQVLRDYTERRMPVLAARLRTDVEEILRVAEGTGPEHEVSWLGGARLPVIGLLAHLLNEMNIHAWDIARALRVPWVIDPADAALFVDHFLVGMTRHGYGRLLDRDGPVHPGRISVTIRHMFGPEVTLALVAGRVTVETPDPRPDVRIAFDPTVFTLVLFGRVHRFRAMLTRKVSVSGRRPWLLPVFMRTMRPPP
ncbi:hypothetical protein E1193_02285 [Micromonospora sp. KC606]|uniref:maleylpyruvate isomerase N-terminal domain-containing protein n=1 Tax=Micromonospora sp. KC606 TaxID=2530379 RepID=UPI0010447714|nr:maleylpyruvate isomerase N-terminal domain-containing protein [Micromonospora sp. KC606]TDC85665.1 hypothetical protein E1193_02285 [Micromonospora sp. KC606]